MKRPTTNEELADLLESISRASLEQLLSEEPVTSSQLQALITSSMTAIDKMQMLRGNHTSLKVEAN